MKNAEDLNSLGLHEVGNSVVLLEEYPNLALRPCVALAHLWMVRERLSAVVDALHRSCGSVRIVLRDVLEDIFEPTQRFVGPD